MGQRSMGQISSDNRVAKSFSANVTHQFSANYWHIDQASDIPVLKIISVLVSIKFEINHFSIIFYTVGLSQFFSVLVSIKFFRNNFSSVSVSVFTSFQ